jgi:hypothetical protein
MFVVVLILPFIMIGGWGALPVIERFDFGQDENLNHIVIHNTIR